MEKKDITKLISFAGVGMLGVKAAKNQTKIHNDRRRALNSLLAPIAGSYELEQRFEQYLKSYLTVNQLNDLERSLENILQSSFHNYNEGYFARSVIDIVRKIKPGGSTVDEMDEADEKQKRIEEDTKLRNNILTQLNYEKQIVYLIKLIEQKDISNEDLKDYFSQQMPTEDTEKLRFILRDILSKTKDFETKYAIDQFSKQIEKVLPIAGSIENQKIREELFQDGSGI